MKPARFSRIDLLGMADETDRPLLELLLGAEAGSDYYYSHYSSVSQAIVPPALAEVVLPRICATGRCGLIPQVESYGEVQFTPVSWDEGPPWRFEADWTFDESTREWRLGVF